MSVRDLTSLAQSLPLILGSAQSLDGQRPRIDKLDDLDPLHGAVRALRKLEAMWQAKHELSVLVLWWHYVRSAGTLDYYEIATTLASPATISDWARLPRAARRSITEQWGKKLLLEAVRIYDSTTDESTLDHRNLGALTSECDRRLVTVALRKERKEQRKERQKRVAPLLNKWTADALAQLHRDNPKATNEEVQQVIARVHAREVSEIPFRVERMIVENPFKLSVAIVNDNKNKKSA